MAKRKRPPRPRPIKDSTDAQFEDSLVDYSPPDSGYDPKFEEEDTTENLYGAGARTFPQSLWIPQSEWKDWARENDRMKIWAENFRNRFTNQSPTHECTCHALIQGFEAAWNGQRSSRKSAVFMSALSVYAEANPRIRGGSSMQKTVGIAIRRGILPEHNGPRGESKQKERFKHTLNCTQGKGNSQCSSGPWVSVSNFPQGWKDTARHFRANEVINCESWEQMICCLLQGRVVCVGRKGHAIPYNRVLWRDGRLYAAYSDSYDVIRYDSMSNIRQAVGGSYCIWSTTIPDNWDKPTGGA